MELQLDLERLERVLEAAERQFEDTAKKLAAHMWESPISECECGDECVCCEETPKVNATDLDKWDRLTHDVRVLRRQLDGARSLLSRPMVSE